MVAAKFDEDFAEYMTMVNDNYATIASSYSDLHPSLSSPAQFERLEVFGATVAYHLIHMGTVPCRLSPALIFLAATQAHPSTLPERLIESLFPEVHEKILQWRAFGPSGDPMQEPWRGLLLTLFPTVHVRSLFPSCLF